MFNKHGEAYSPTKGKVFVTHCTVTDFEMAQKVLSRDRAEQVASYVKRFGGEPGGLAIRFDALSGWIRSHSKLHLDYSRRIAHANEVKLLNLAPFMKTFDIAKPWYLPVKGRMRYPEDERRLYGSVG